MTIPGSEQDTDTALLTAVRAGDTGAFGTLYERHRASARQFAYGLVRDPADAEDLVAETFVKVFASLRAGRGPLVAFRAYLHTTMRHVCYHRARRDRRLEFTDDLSRYDEGQPFTDPALDRLERAYAAAAFRKLPPRWQDVLWQTEVEGNTPAEVAGVLGMTPNAVAVLAHRAREGLRSLYLQQHVAVAEAPGMPLGGRPAGRPAAGPARPAGRQPDARPPGLVRRVPGPAGRDCTRSTGSTTVRTGSVTMPGGPVKTRQRKQRGVTAPGTLGCVPPTPASGLRAQAPGPGARARQVRHGRRCSRSRSTPSSSMCCSASAPGRSAPS